VGTLAAIGRARPVSDVTSYYLGLKQEGRERQRMQMFEESHAQKMALAQIATQRAEREEARQLEQVDLKTSPLFLNSSKKQQAFFRDFFHRQGKSTFARHELDTMFQEDPEQKTVVRK
jgi:hypothetical protein